MREYLAPLNRRVRISRLRARAFEIMISNWPDTRGWWTYGVAGAVVFLMLAIGTFD